MILMLKQFSLKLGEAAAAASWFDILNLHIINSRPVIAITQL